VVFLISKQKGPVKRWEGWPSTFESNWGKHCCVCRFSQKWPSNRIKNDSRIFEEPHDCISSDSERGFGKGKEVCTFSSTILDTWATKIESHLAKTLSRCPMQTKIALTKYYWIRDFVFCLRHRNKSGRILNDLVRH
jgi:hypothetical protein